MLGDLHIHSVYSDGDYAPAALAAKCAAAGCAVVALSDHDTVCGVEEMSRACKNYGIINLPAIEISAYDESEIHILGYNIDYKQSGFCTFLAHMADERERRALATLEKLARHRIYVDREELAGIAQNQVSRSHIATVIAAKGYEADSRTAFEKWLAEGAPAYAVGDRTAAAEAIAQIKAAAGQAVLAHPVRIKKTLAEKAELVKKLRAAGLDGIEAVYKNSSGEATAFYTELARLHGLFITAGGDFHGDRNRILPRRLEKKTLEKLGLL